MSYPFASCQCVITRQDAHLKCNHCQLTCKRDGGSPTAWDSRTPSQKLFRNPKIDYSPFLNLLMRFHLQLIKLLQKCLISDDLSPTMMKTRWPWRTWLCSRLHTCTKICMHDLSQQPNNLTGVHQLTASYSVSVQTSCGLLSQFPTYLISRNENILRHGVWKRKSAEILKKF